MRDTLVAVCFALLAPTPSARADEAAKDQQIARLKAEVERLTKRVQGERTRNHIWRRAA